MLPKASRITTQDFKGKKTRLIYRGAFFDVSIAQAETTKFACVVAKKRIKRAVDRNKARRKIYTLLASVTTKTPLFIFVYPTKNVLTAPYPALKEEIRAAFATL